MCIKFLQKFFIVEKNYFNIVEGNLFPGTTNPSIIKARFLPGFFIDIKTETILVAMI